MIISGGINFGDNYINGIEAMAMTSSEQADKMVEMFETAIMAGYHPNEVEQQIYRIINPDSLLSYDKEMVQRKVNEIWNAYQGEHDYYA